MCFPAKSCCVFPAKSSRDSSMLVSNQSSIHCYCSSRRVFDTGDPTVDQVTLLILDIQDSFSVKK